MADGGHAGRGIALVGAGYWGSRLARNLAAALGASVRWVCDLDRRRAAHLADPIGARPTDSLAEVLGDPGVDAVVVATPAPTHEALVAACLAAERHVLVEKPLALSVDAARALAETARARDLVVMCDHTYRFAPAVRALRAVVADGVLGTFAGAHSVRTNHHHGQPDLDVLWDLAHHDVSILTWVLPAEARPIGVRAQCTDALGIGRAHAGSLTLHLADGAEAHVRVDWCAEAKVRTMRLAGTDAVLDWDDLDPSGPRLELRSGDTAGRVPVDDVREPLAIVVHEFLAAIAEHRAAECGPDAELEVLRVLECATRSASAGGIVVPLAPAPESRPVRT